MAGVPKGVVLAPTRGVGVFFAANRLNFGAVASGIELALSGMRSVKIPNDNADGSNSQSRRLFEPRRRDHSLVGQLALSLSTWGRSLRVVGRPLRADDRLTLELNCQSEDVKSYRRSKRHGGEG
jgi:hypothetical protein